MTGPTQHSPSLGVYSDKQLVDELYIRIKRGGIHLETVGDEPHATVRIFCNGREGRHGFDAIAYQPPVAHI